MKTAIFLFTLLLSISGYSKGLQSQFVDISKNNGILNNGLIITLKSDAADLIMKNFSKGKRGVIGKTNPDGTYEERYEFNGKHIVCQKVSIYSQTEVESLCEMTLSPNGTIKRAD